MSKKSIAIGVVSLIAAGFVGAAVSSKVEAQSDGKPPVILVVDRAQLVAGSVAGKTIPDQARKVQDNVRKELEAEVKKLEDDISKFQKNASLMSEEVRQKTQAELAMRQQRSLPLQAQIVEQAFVQAVEGAQAKVLIESQPILKDIVEKRGATVLLDRAAVMYAAPETNVTAEVLKELDKKLKSVEVEKIKLSDVQKKLEELAAAQRKAAEEASKKK
ncbi:MAG: OmpH family outer membrane protein [Pseudomonadota bacterium]